MAFDHVCLSFVWLIPPSAPGVRWKMPLKRERGHGRARLCGFCQLQLLRLCWKLQSSVWLCDTEIYSIGFQGIDCFHLCHSIPPGLSHLLLWHSLKARSQKRTFWTMGLLSYSAFSDLLNSLLHHSAITPHPTFPDPLFSSNLGICPCHLPHSTGAPQSSLSSHHFWYRLWLLFLGPFPCLAYSHVFGATLLHTCIPEKHLIRVYLNTSLFYSERGRFKRKYFSLSPSFISGLKKKSWIVCGSFSKHVLLDTKKICV